MTTTNADVLAAIGYKAVCHDGPVGVMDALTAEVVTATPPSVVVSHGVLMFTKRHLVPMAAVRHVDHSRQVVSLNGTRAQLTATEYDPDITEPLPQVTGSEVAAPEVIDVAEAPAPALPGAAGNDPLLADPSSRLPR